MGARAVHLFRSRDHLSGSHIRRLVLSSERGAQKEETRRKQQQHKLNARSKAVAHNIPPAGEAIAQMSREWGRADGKVSMTPTRRLGIIKPSPSLHILFVACTELASQPPFSQALMMLMMDVDGRARAVSGAFVSQPHCFP